MTKDKVSLGVIGVGAVAQIAHLPAFRKFPGVEITAISDENEQKMRQVAEKHGVRRIFSDFEDLLEMEEIDGVVIATPNYLHAPMSIAALNYGKHVLCERPMAMSAKDARDMLRAAAQNKRTLLIGFNQRYRPDAQMLKTFIEKKALGEVFYIKTGWLRRRTDWSAMSWAMREKSAGGGVFLDLGTQILDLALWLCGYPRVEAVSAVTYRKGKGYDVEDSGSAFLRLEKGSVLSTEVSWTLIFDKDLTYLNFFGTQGAALLNPLRIHKELHGQLMNVTPVAKLSANVHKASYEAQASHFVDCIREGVEPAVRPEECLALTEILEGVYRSARLGQEVEIGAETKIKGRG